MADVESQLHFGNQFWGRFVFRVGELEFSPGPWDQEELVQGWLPSVRRWAEQRFPGARGTRFPGRVIRSASLEGWWDRRRHALRLYSCPRARLVPKWSKTVEFWVCKVATEHSFIGYTLFCCHRPLDELFSISEFQLPLFFVSSLSLSFFPSFLFVILKKIEVELPYNVMKVTGIQYSDSQILKVHF